MPEYFLHQLWRTGWNEKHFRRINPTISPDPLFKLCLVNLVVVFLKCAKCFFCLIQVADSIVRKARESLELSIKLVEDTPHWKAKVVYGDTDR